VNHNNPPTQKLQGAGWQFLGKLDLPIDANLEVTIYRWLTDILHPLNLHEEFLNKILKSAQAATVRVTQARTVIKSDHIHLMIFVLSNRGATKQNWGFFRVEKIENTAEANSAPDHAIEFYLYVEG